MHHVRKACYSINTHILSLFSHSTSPFPSPTLPPFLPHTCRLAVTSKMSTPGRALLALVAVITCAGGYVFDWNETHIYNPRWPPHAKFHNGQTMSTGLLLGISALYYLFRPTVSRAMERESLYTATLLTSLNWVAQLSAALYPGSLPVDPEFGDGFPQLYICAVLLSIVAVGTMLEDRRLKTNKRREVKSG